MTRRTAAALLLHLAGCSVPAGGGENAYVLLDEGARQAGLAVQDGAGVRASVRPVAITGEQTVVIDASGAAQNLEVMPGEVVLVRGAAGQVDRWPLGTVRPDLLVASGEETALRHAAMALEADLAPREDGRWELIGPEVYERSAALESDPAGVLELLPALGDDAALPEVVAVSATSFGGATSGSGDTGADVFLAGAGVSQSAAVEPEARPTLTSLTPSGFAFTVAAPGTYAMSLRSSYSGGCSRSWTNSTTSAAMRLAIAADGTTTLCRMQATRSSTVSMHFDTADGPGRSFGEARHEVEQRGFRGRWHRHDDATVIELVADDSVCGAAHDGTMPVERWTLRCSAVRARGTGDAAVALPGAGLACAVVPEAWRENRGYTVSLEGTDWVLLGSDAGWDIESSGGRFGWPASGTTVTRRPTAPVIDLRTLGFAIP